MTEDMPAEQRNPWTVAQIKTRDFVIWQTDIAGQSGGGQAKPPTLEQPIRACDNACRGQQGVTLRLPEQATGHLTDNEDVDLRTAKGLRVYEAKEIRIGEYAVTGKYGLIRRATKELTLGNTARVSGISAWDTIILATMCARRTLQFSHQDATHNAD